MKTYRAKGIVWGKYWGGGSGGYEATPVKADSMDELHEKIHKLFDSKELDGGMGFERLTGATMLVEIEETITINGKEYSHIDYEDFFVGEVKTLEKDKYYEMTFGNEL